MMQFQDISTGTSMFFDPVLIVGVIPAFAPPPSGVKAEQWIPRAIGAQVLLSGCAPVAVRGDAAKLADEIALEKARARIAPALN